MHQPEKIVIQFVTSPDEFENLLEKFVSKTTINIPIEANEKEEELLTISQLAKFFQVSETTIHKWKNEGIIPYIRIKSRIRFRKSEVLQLHEKRRIGKNNSHK